MSKKLNKKFHFHLIVKKNVKQQVLIHESFFLKNVLPHSVEKREILSHQKNISSNQLFSNLFSKTVTFTEFLP